MNKFNGEYFNEYYYFNLTEDDNNILLNYSVAETLVESSKQEKTLKLNKNNGKKINGLINKFLKSKKKFSPKFIEFIVLF